MEVVDILRVALAMTMLILASRQDLRERMAEDYHWIVIGTAGLLYLIYTIFNSDLSRDYLILVLAVGILFYDIFLDRPDGYYKITIAIYLSALIMIFYVAFYNYQDPYFWTFLAVAILYLLFVLFYMFDIIKGGADAKCLIALAILFPNYPTIMGFPLIPIPSSAAELVLPFALMVLFHAALFTVLSVFYNLQRNIRNRSLRFPQSFLGYELSIADARKGQYWPMEAIKDGVPVLKHSPQDGAEEIYGELERLGRDKVWVTPKIPFLIPITIAVLFITIIGNIMFLI